MLGQAIQLTTDRIQLIKTKIANLSGLGPAVEEILSMWNNALAVEEYILEVLEKENMNDLVKRVKDGN